MHRGMKILPLLYRRHSSFSNPSTGLPTSQLILQPFCCFTYIIGTSPTSQLILQPFCCFTYITGHSTTLPLLHLRHMHFTYVTTQSPTLQPLHLRHSTFYNPSATSLTSQVNLQLFHCFTYVIGTSCTSPGEQPMHRGMKKTVCDGLACYSKLLSLEVATVLDGC